MVDIQDTNDAEGNGREKMSDDEVMARLLAMEREIDADAQKTLQNSEAPTQSEYCEIHEADGALHINITLNDFTVLTEFTQGTLATKFTQPIRKRIIEASKNGISRVVFKYDANLLGPRIHVPNRSIDSVAPMKLISDVVYYVAEEHLMTVVPDESWQSLAGRAADEHPPRTEATGIPGVDAVLMAYYLAGDNKPKAADLKQLTIALLDFMERRYPEIPNLPYVCGEAAILLESNTKLWKKKDGRKAMDMFREVV